MSVKKTLKGIITTLKLGFLLSIWRVVLSILRVPKLVLYIIRNNIKLRDKSGKYYANNSPIAKQERKTIIVICDGKVKPGGGFSDRLMGIASAYYIAKELGCDFKIHFNSPFELNHVFMPNHVDWIIDKEDISYNSQCTIVFNYMRLNTVCLFVQKWFLKYAFNKSYKQIHIYTNSSLAIKKGVYSNIINELFELTPDFVNELDDHKQTLTNKYISVSTRFGVTLGDLTDTCGCLISQEEQELLIQSCISHIKHLRDDYPGYNVFVTSDSERFINRVTELDFVYAVKGERLNIDQTECRDWDILKIALIDFFLIADAHFIFQLKGSNMYSGRFSRSAADIYNKPYKLIEF